MRNCLSCAAALAFALVLGCGGVPPGSPRHFKTIDEWRDADLVDEQFLRITEPGECGHPHYKELADRYDYLEAFGCSINRFRGEPVPESCREPEE